MKKFIFPIFMLSALVGCSTVPAGHVGVKVYLLGTSKGVDHEVLPIGRYWIGWNEKLYLFPTFQQNYVWTASSHEGSAHDESITFQTKEGMSINMDVGISYSLDPKQVATVFQKYRRGVDEITDIFLRNAVRDAINENGSRYVVEDVYGSKKSEFLKSVEKDVRDEVGPIGIEIDRIYIVGAMRLPENVLAALNGKIQATQDAQRAQNQVAMARAEAEKAIAIAKGEAEANRVKQASLSESLIKYEAIQKWDGKLPQVTGGGMPFIQVPQSSAAK